MTTHIFFDLDDTLYDEKFDVEGYMAKRRMEYYKKNNLNYSDKYYTYLFQTYGTSLRGLAIEKDVHLDLIDFLDYIGKGASKLITYSKTELKWIQDMLLELSKRKDAKLWLLTNGTDNHCKEIIEKMDIKKYFVGIITQNDFHKHKKYLSKPAKEAFSLAEKISKFDVKKDNAWLIENSRKNIVCALKREKWRGVYLYYKDDREKVERKNCINIKDIFEIKKKVPELFKGVEK